MHNAVCHFPTIKDALLSGRGGKKGNPKANALRMELIKKRTVGEEFNAEMMKQTEKWDKMNVWQDYLMHEIVISNKLDANFNSVMIHIMSHRAEQSHQYRSFQQESAVSSVSNGSG